MGCAQSKPAVKEGADPPAVGLTKPRPSQDRPANGTTPASAFHTPSQQAGPNISSPAVTISSVAPSSGGLSGDPDSVRSRRELRQKRSKNSQLDSAASASDCGPVRDYEGLKLVKADNDRLIHIVTLASSILKAALCFVVLGQADKMVLAKSIGIEDQDMSWLPAACAWSLVQGRGLVVVENMETNEETKGLSWVKDEPQICFYAGTPICSTSGQRLGCMCVMDFEPRSGVTMICNSLPNLAEMVSREVQAEEQMNSGEELLNRAIDTYWDACVYIDVSKKDHWRIKYANGAFTALTEISAEEAHGQNLWDIVELAGSYIPTDPQGKLTENLRRLTTHEIQPIVFVKGKAALKGSLASRKMTYKMNMRPMRQLHVTNYSLPFDEEEMKLLWFAIISPFSNSEGQYSGREMDISMVPFEGVEMGPIIGKGSFGSVFKATYSGRVVAIKIIPFSDLAKVDASGQPLEASLMLDMKHPNIVETYKHALQSNKLDEEGRGSANTSGGSQNSGSGNLQFWLLLEFCDVGTLSDGLSLGLLHERLQDGDSTIMVPKVTFILETLRDIARGMAHVHSYNILHSDLTAGNVLLDSTDAGVQGTRNFVAKIADFGLSRQALTSKIETNTYGTVTHMPPELLNEGHVSKAADVYAFGVLVYEAYTNKPVWEGLRHPQIIHAIAVQRKHPQLPESAPSAIRDLANACMAAEPGSRPTFPEVVAKLDRMLEPIIKAPA